VSRRTVQRNERTNVLGRGDSSSHVFSPTVDQTLINLRHASVKLMFRLNEDREQRRLPADRPLCDRLVTGRGGSGLRRDSSMCTTAATATAGIDGDMFMTNKPAKQCSAYQHLSLHATYSSSQNICRNEHEQCHTRMNRHALTLSHISVIAY